jgi:hypothetical protein
VIDVDELMAIAEFVESGRGSAESVFTWCQARHFDLSAVLRLASALSRSSLESIARVECESPGSADVEAAIAAAIVRAMQIGADAERRRRDREDLPL